MPIIGNYHLPLKWHFQSPYEGLFNQLKSKKARGKETASLEMAGRNLVTIPAPDTTSKKHIAPSDQDFLANTPQTKLSI